jgi:uncharacterized protein YwgA
MKRGKMERNAIVQLGGVDENTRERNLKNRLQLLYLIHKAKTKGFLGITKIQKLCFLAEFSQANKGFKGFDFTFFRWYHGPMSKEIYQSLETFENEGVIHKKDGDFSLDERGAKILKVFTPIFEEKSNILKEVDKVVEEFGEMNASSLKEYIYNTFMAGEKFLRDAELGTDLIMPFSEQAEMFTLSEEWLETLDIYLDKDLYEGLTQSLKIAQIDKPKPWQDV